jgi:hypothetical protein
MNNNMGFNINTNNSSNTGYNNQMNLNNANNNVNRGSVSTINDPLADLFG